MRAFLSLGSNMGDSRRLLADAIDSLPDVVSTSPVYETDPIGGPDQSNFLNLVVELDTGLTPLQLLGVCHRIEASAERTREVHWGPRTLDIDIIWMDGVEMDTERLTIPHPRWQQRRFVLAPLRDLAPDLVSERVLQLSEGTVQKVADL